MSTDPDPQNTFLGIVEFGNSATVQLGELVHINLPDISLSVRYCI